LVAAVAIAIAAWGRLWHPQPLGDVWLGLGVSLVATALNGVVAVVLWRAGRRLRSITLRADAKHLLTDVWTSAGVLAGVLLVPLTGWLRLDPLIALVVALNIVWTGLRLLHETGSGLLDAACRPRTGQSSTASWRPTPHTASSSTPCGRGWPGSGASSRCMCSCRATGR
jgi:cation diffusion facilitator family transporter